MKRLTILLLLLSFVFTDLKSQVHTTYLWHLQQPNYWPEQSQWDTFHYQTVRESDWLKNNNGNWYSDGQQHPLNNLEEIFNKDDRKAVYQYRTKDAIQSLLGLPDAGAQISYSGCLIENINSLANAGQWGYSSGWKNNFVTARNWQTSGGNPRMDIVGFTMHHAISPLLSERVFRKQLQAYKYIYEQTFGTSPGYSKGYWPAECAFSERIIKVLAEEGYEWSVIANSHLARTLSDYPLTYGTSGCNIDPPNGADIVNTNGINWWSGQIDGRGGTFAAPYCYQAHKAKYVDPETGTEYVLTVVPMAEILSYQNGYALMGTGDIDAHIAPFDNPSQPSIVLLAHDGDNAWGGGYDYYTNSVPGFANEAASKGYIPSTVQQFLDDNPVPAGDIVHVEDGSWFNAANDWGHPQFINWLWPMYTQNYEFDPNGWTEDARNWAVLTAAENRVETAENIEGGTGIQDIVNPNSSSSLSERAWHHLLPAYTSGYMYYGTSLDMEVKQSLACNIATGFADQVISANQGTDNTPPTVFIPQRYPYNPGSTGFGPTYGYQQHQNSSDFTIWTFAYDVSGLQSITLKYRLDNDGTNPITDNDNDTYTGGPGVQGWVSLPMNERVFPTGNVTGNPDINFFILPDYIANEYYAEISGLSDTLVDYYIEATDTKGNTFKTPIQHVYVGNYNPGGGGGGTYEVSWQPENPSTDDTITIIISNPPKTGKLHWGVNYQGSNWQTPDNVYRPAGTYLFNGTGPAVETPLPAPDENNEITLKLGPFNNPVQQVYSLAFVIHYDDETWDNNNGNDYHISIGSQGITGVVWEPQNPNQYDSVRILVGQVSTGANLHWGIDNGSSSWITPVNSYWPEGSFLFNGNGPAVESPFSGPDINNTLSIILRPFNDPEQQVEGVNFVIHYDDNTWDNNNGNDYFIPINNITSFSLDLKVFLEGFYTNGEMTTILNIENLVPLSQPYSSAPWNYDGTESVVSIPNTAVVDWILVELRDADAPTLATQTTMIARQAGFILSDGKIVGTDGVSDMQFDAAFSRNLYVVVFHRNHLGIISSVGLTQTDGLFSYDFTIGSHMALGDTEPQKELANGVFGMYAGDINSNGNIGYDDKILWSSDAGKSNYLNADTKSDGEVDNTDKNETIYQNIGRVSYVPD